MKKGTTAPKPQPQVNMGITGSKAATTTVRTGSANRDGSASG